MHFSQFNFKSQLLIISLSIFLLLPILNGQQIEHVGGKKYQYEGQVYKYGEMDHVFRQDKFSYVEYRKAIQKSKTAKSSGIMALIGVGVGIGIVVLHEPDTDNTLTNADFTTEGLLGGVVVLLVLGSGLGALGAAAGSAKWKRKSIDTFNQYALDKGNENSTSMSAQLGLLSNGRVGIVFNF